MIIDFVKGLATTIETKSAEMREAGGKLAFAIIDGMTGGLASKVKDIAASAWEMGRKAIEAIKGAIDSNSPSKETYKLGEYTGDGFALGISSGNGIVSKAATRLGGTAVSTLKKSIGGLASSLSSEMDMTPTIRPVLDLSAIKKDSGLIDGMIKAPSLTLDVKGSYAKASTLAVDTRSNTDITPALKSEQPVTPVAGPKIELTQINNSPKALSTIEIYRNTNNQISTLKGIIDEYAKQS
jgi:hypothetical protein